MIDMNDSQAHWDCVLVMQNATQISDNPKLVFIILIICNLKHSYWWNLPGCLGTAENLIPSVYIENQTRFKKEAWIIQFNIDKYDKIFDNDKGVHFILFFWNPKTNSGWNKDDDDIISSVLSV